MSFSFRPSEPIRKARRPAWKSTRTRQRLDALSKTMGKSVGVDLFKGISTFKKRIDPERVYQAYLHRDFTKIRDSIPWSRLDSEIDPAYTSVGKALESSWGMSVESVAAFLERVKLPPTSPLLRWDTQNPRIRNFITKRREGTFRDLSRDSVQNIQRWTLRSMDYALTPRQVASGIKDQIGLLPAHANALRAYRTGLIAGGMSPGQVDALSSQRADALLEYRAMMIGRTETRLATNQGQLSVWRQAADQGLIDRRTTSRRWSCDGENPCEDCEPMDGQSVALDSPFIMPDGTPIDCPPDGVHPQCDCSEDIVHEGDDE